MAILDKLLGKHHIGRCSYQISSSNDLKPSVEEIKNDKGECVSLKITPQCVCGSPQATFEWDDPTSMILERMVEQRTENERTAKHFAYEVGTSKTDMQYCSTCGREIAITGIFNLDKPAQDKFFEAREKATEQLNYGSALNIEVSVDGGYFVETRQLRTLQDLISPKCNCGARLYCPKIRENVETMIQKIDDFWLNDQIRFQIEKIASPKLVIREDVRCSFCLLDVTVIARIEPTLPKKEHGISEIVRRYKAWNDRMRT